MIVELIERLKRNLYFIIHHDQELNRRVEIENTLFKMSEGKLPLPTKKGCRVLALKLGTPKEFWRKGWKNRQKEGKYGKTVIEDYKLLKNGEEIFTVAHSHQSDLEKELARMPGVCVKDSVEGSYDKIFYYDKNKE